MKRVFSEVHPPVEHKKLEVNKVARWFTWNKRIMHVLERFAVISDKIPDPILIHLSGGKCYDYTYSLKLDQLPSVILQDELRCMAETLRNIRLKDELWLFTKLIKPLGCARTLHIVLSCLRDALTTSAKNSIPALYAPLSNTGRDAGDFPLHADLYLPEILFNIFVDVPRDRSGASILLSVPVFEEALYDANVPENKRRALLRYLHEPIQRDSYQQFYNLLHDEKQAWHPRLAKFLACRQYRIKLLSGQGYMVNDRKWLHGRSAPRGGVRKNRLHRLVFQSNG